MTVGQGSSRMSLAEKVKEQQSSTHKVVATDSETEQG